MKTNFLEPLHLYLITIIATGFMVHVLILPSLLTSASRDAWISVIFGIVPLAIMIFIIYSIIRMLNGRTLMGFLQKNYPVPLHLLIGMLFSLIFICESYITIKFTADWAKSAYTTEVPYVVIIICLIVVCFFASFKVGTLLGY